jgi:ribosomal-protein-alanine N-acetyltransferase
MAMDLTPIAFKKLTINYLANFQRVFNNEEFSHYLNCPYPLTRDWSKEYIESSMEKFEKGEKYTFAVISKKTNSFIGVAVIKNIDKKNRIAELGYCIDKAYWNKGFTEMSVYLLLEYAFTRLNINRIEIRVDCENKKTINFMDKLGAMQEGKLRQAVFNNGKFCDIYLYSIIHDDYLRWKVNKAQYDIE